MPPSGEITNHKLQITNIGRPSDNFKRLRRRAQNVVLYYVGANLVFARFVHFIAFFYSRTACFISYDPYHPVRNNLETLDNIEKHEIKTELIDAIDAVKKLKSELDNL